MGGGGRVPTGFGGQNPFFPDIPPTIFDAIEQDKKRSDRKKPKRKASKSQMAYGRAFKLLAPKYKKKNGSWKKDGFKRCVRAAHRECRRKHR